MAWFIENWNSVWNNAVALFKVQSITEGKNARVVETNEGKLIPYWIMQCEIKNQQPAEELKKIYSKI